MVYRNLSAVWVVLICIGLLGCGKPPQPVPVVRISQEPPSGCPGIFVLAPVEYLLYFHGDDPILLASEGRQADLAVYCTAEEAQKAEQDLEQQRLLIPGLWRVYQLHGEWEKDVVEVTPGTWRMRRPSELIPYPEGREVWQQMGSGIVAATENRP